MSHRDFELLKGKINVVGSFGSLSDLLNVDLGSLGEACDLVEIRLDLLPVTDDESAAPWTMLGDFPILFTARRKDEGSPLDLDAQARMRMLESILDRADCIDIEVASIGEMGAIIHEIRDRKIPWVASWHDFGKLPETDVLKEAAVRAKEAGAAAFKAAARLASPADMARLAEFQLADHGIPVSTMGMGPLAPVSRLLCAQSGSVLNYGYLGATPTAPGQWDSALLKTAISRLAPFPG
ncbi:MAG: type I 3-dehydroquinate dehydratase [Verrucomicrobiaceae bacterium]|nr:MAG: type I 3-dehydroquinate dehydratase [Verrucomicrobiaceae bacterium]